MLSVDVVSKAFELGREEFVDVVDPGTAHLRVARLEDVRLRSTRRPHSEATPVLADTRSEAHLNELGSKSKPLTQFST